MIPQSPLRSNLVMRMKLFQSTIIVGVIVALICVRSATAGDPPRNGEKARVASDAFEKSLGNRGVSGLIDGWRGAWEMSEIRGGTVVDSPASSGDAKGSDGSQGQEIRIGGTGKRNNPLRRELAEPFRSKELFVRFRFRYDTDVNQEQSHADGEFFVMWLDRFEGTDQATHGSHVPNIGLHVVPDGPHQGRNLLMVRIGSDRTAWSRIELERGQSYVVVGRMRKSNPTDRGDYDRFDLWVNPSHQDLDHPDATAHNPQSISAVHWVGFSTGLKTEASDHIFVDNLVLSRTWDDALDGITPATTAKPIRNDFGDGDRVVNFGSEVYPLLKSRCFECHAGRNPDSGYRLDVHDELLGYSTGEALVRPGRSDESRLIEILESENEDERMPPADAGDSLTEKQVALLRAWIDQGAKWDDQRLPPPKLESDHWAFQPVKRPPLPGVARDKWVRTPVDAFIAARQEAANVVPSAPVSRRALIRRLSLDLIGLPPTTVEIDAFLADRSPEAYEDLVEGLLASEHYGERWGRYWLDLTRWAESHGYQHDLPRPYAWRYRDYVVASFNADKPYDRFLLEQIAGDELQPYRDQNLIATGFLAAARISGNQQDKAMQRNAVLTDIVNTTSSALLGLTLGCAQCHNHKFEPLSQRDHYRMQAFFDKGQLGNLSLQSHDVPNPTDFDRWMPEATFDFYVREAKKLVAQGRFKTTTRPHTWGYYSPATGDASIDRMPVVNRSPIPYQPEELKRTRTRLLIRGDVHTPGPEVSSGWPAVLGPTPEAFDGKERTALARWMADPQNPLVSRVWVNRIWGYHFDRGIVATPSDFGKIGQPPSHPLLLDWLASELMDNGWSTKHLHRLIVLSGTYRQSIDHNDANTKIDPENRLLWRWPRRRLEAEAIRDSILVATGELERSVGGPSVPPSREEEELRRTIYLYQRRSEMPAIMALFDAPDGVVSCARREVSTVALQPLFMLNSQFMTRRAAALAAKVQEIAGDDPKRQVQTAFLRTLGRMPESNEIAQSLKLLGAASAKAGPSALQRFCHAMLNVNEFAYTP